MMCLQKPGRPVGEKRQALSHWVLAHEKFTMGQLVKDLGWSVKEANDHIRLARLRAELVVIDKVPQPGCKRKVALYGHATVIGSHALQAAMSAWTR